MKNVIAKSYLNSQFGFVDAPLVAAKNSSANVSLTHSELMNLRVPSWFLKRFGIEQVQMILNDDESGVDLMIDSNKTLFIRASLGVTRAQLIDELYEFFRKNKGGLIIRILEFLTSLLGLSPRAQKIAEGILAFVKGLFGQLNFLDDIQLFGTNKIKNLSA